MYKIIKKITLIPLFFIASCTSSSYLDSALSRKHKIIKRHKTNNKYKSKKYKNNPYAKCNNINFESFKTFAKSGKKYINFSNFCKLWFLTNSAFSLLAVTRVLIYRNRYECKLDTFKQKIKEYKNYINSKSIDRTTDEYYKKRLYSLINISEETDSKISIEIDLFKQDQLSRYLKDYVALYETIALVNSFYSFNCIKMLLFSILCSPFAGEHLTCLGTRYNKAANFISDHLQRMPE